MGCGGSKTVDDELSSSNAPAAYYATGAALPQANGLFVRDGNYQGAPLFKNAQFWLLRYQLPSGVKWWYIADKDRLDSNDGDLYRVKSGSVLPPLAGWGLAQDGVAPAPVLQPFLDAASAPTTPPPPPPAQSRVPKIGADGQEMAQNFEDEEIPGAYYISGAAVAQANGVYARDGTYSGAPLFKNGQLWLLRYTLPSGDRHWYIADKDQLDQDKGDLYRVKSPSGLPPQSGWVVAQDGIAPAPTLQALADEGPAGYFVHQAGRPEANGAYVRDGSYSSCPLYKQANDGAYWLLRYRMPKGSHYWYIADKSSLERDDGDLYRVKSDADTPPAGGWSLAKDGVAPAPTLSPYYPMPVAAVPVEATLVEPSPSHLPADQLTTMPMGTPMAMPMAMPMMDAIMDAHMPMVMGVTVVTSWTMGGTPDGGWANVPTVPSAPRLSTLVEKCEVLGRELGLSGTLKEVVEKAAEQLGVEAGGRPLAAVAESCVQALGTGAGTSPEPK